MTRHKVVAKAELKFDDSVIPLDIIEGSEKEKAVDIRGLRKETGLITLDPGFVNTGSCESAITFIDGEKGILRYRGYPIEEIASKCSFTEVAYLMIHGKLPSQNELDEFSELLTRNAMVPEGLRTFIHRYPDHAHPMAILSAMVVSLSTFYPEWDASDEEDINIAATRILSKLRTLAAFSYKKSIGEPYIYPKSQYKFCENILNMMFASPVAEYEVNPDLAAALNRLLILHADHEQNCSTSVVRMVGSSEANLYASIAAGICALWGPLHGGANQAVLEMLEGMLEEGKSPREIIERAKTDPHHRLMGFGHRVYKTYDPRARIAKQCCEDVLATLGQKDPLLDLAMELEQLALEDEYFKERHLYPNVDYYTGLSYRAMGFPSNMFTVLFALGRVPGWIAQWLELRNDPDRRIGRPRQIYVGPVERPFVPIEKRDG